MILPWIFLFQLWTEVAFAIMKLIRREEKLVGKDLLATLLGNIALTSAFLGLGVYFLVILNILKSFADMLVENRRIRVMEYFATLKILCGLIPIISFISSYSVVIGVRYPKLQRTLVLASMITYGFLSLFFGYLIASAIMYLRRELVKHITIFEQTSEGVRLVLKRLTVAYYMLLVMTFLIGISFFMFCPDYMLRKSSYLVLWLLISWPPASTVLILTVSHVSNRVEPGMMDPGSASDLSDTPQSIII
jgi:hypothetical protein